MGRTFLERKLQLTDYKTFSLKKKPKRAKLLYHGNI